MTTRIFVFLRHLCQATAACLTAMTQGDLATITAEHWVTALKTGTGTGFIGVFLSFGNTAKIQANRYGVASIAFIATVIADYLNHPSHFGSQYTEALVTGIGAAALCLAMSFTPIGKAIEKLTSELVRKSQ